MDLQRIFNQNWYIEPKDDSTGIGYKIVEQLHHSQSKYQTIDVYRTAGHGNLLLLDGCVMLTDAHEFLYHEMLVHIPLLSHPNPRRVLVVGGGDGGTVREVLQHDTVERVDMVEIDADVIEISRQYFPGCTSRLDDPKANVVVQDAVEFIKPVVDEYDVILIDSTDPIGPGEGLFNRSFYLDVHKALKAEGIVTIQSESPFSQAREVPVIFHKLQSVFPLTKLYWGPIPCYPYGTWSFTYCSKNNMEPVVRRPDAAADIEQSARFYNREIHQSVFVLPNFIRDLLGGDN